MARREGARTLPARTRTRRRAHPAAWTRRNTSRTAVTGSAWPSGLLWEPDGYTPFIDGRRHGEKIGGGEGEAVSQVEEFLLVTTEAKWYRNKGMTGEGVPELEEAWKAGDAFEVDYVRVFDEIATK